MKKRFFTAVMAAFVIGNVLVGCSAEKDENNSSVLISQDSYLDIKPQYTLITDDYMYVVDENGDKVRGFFKADIIKAIGDEIKISYYLRLVTAFENIAICAYDEYGADEVKFYAYNCDTKEAVNFYNGKFYPSATDYYNDNVLIRYSDVEYSFTINEDLTYTENDPVNEDFFEILADYRMENPQDRSNKGISVARTLDETGYLLVSAKDEDPNGGDSNRGYFMLKSDGSVTALPQIKGERVTIADYDESGIIYETSKDWDFEKAYCLDTDTLEVKELPWEEQKTSLGINDGILYSCDNTESDVYMINIYDYYAYDMASGEERKIFSTRSVPGSGYGLGRKGDFQMCGDNAFVLDVAGDKIKWLRVSYEDGNVSFTDIDCPVRDVTPLSYGTVEYEAESYVCPKCGKVVSKSYEEYPVIDESYSEHADEINNSLKELLTADDFYDYSDDDCDMHDYEEGLFDTHESLVWEMHVINDRFLTVDMSTYSMAVGAAHGYGTDYQVVYDFETGKRLKNEDIFRGDEEQFKTFIAEKTREYAANSDEDERSRFFSPDLDGIYDTAYEIASFGDTNLKFYDDHLELVYLQYEIGPYAAGVFYIDISYEDFIGANTLTIE
jgi:hypothetical protein